jgi:hypothetical protein
MEIVLGCGAETSGLVLEPSGEDGQKVRKML